VRDILTSVTVALLVAGAGAVAAPDQTTARPGDPSRADVWVSNRGGSEAIPVDLRQANLGQPLGIRVLNGDRTTSIPPMRVTAAQTTWEYRTAVVKPNDQLAQTMTALGSQGWETTGIAWPGGDAGTMVLLKRPR
jgi:hypothetical protein